MSSHIKNLSDYNFSSMPSAKDIRFGIVVSEWNHEITKKLYDGAYHTLIIAGAVKKNIITKQVPGSFELPLIAQSIIKYHKVDVVICLGCVIQGETQHFKFIANAVVNGIMKINLELDIPVIFGVLTTDTLAQAKERSGGKHGNKGIEAAVTAIEMADLKKKMTAKY